MESRNHRLGDGKPADNLVDPLHHLGRRFVGKRNRQNRFRHSSQMLDQMGNAVGDDARLAAARTRQDQHRPLHGFDSFALLRIQLIEERQCGGGSGIHYLDFTGREFA